MYLKDNDFIYNRKQLKFKLICYWSIKCVKNQNIFKTLKTVNKYYGKFGIDNMLKWSIKS